MRCPVPLQEFEASRSCPHLHELDSQASDSFQVREAWWLE
jgi:hypothetical protein